MTRTGVILTESANEGAEGRILSPGGAEIREEPLVVTDLLRGALDLIRQILLLPAEALELQLGLGLGQVEVLESID
jgi:hypothetical protein